MTDTTLDSGLTIVRATLKVYARRGNLAGAARDLGIAANDLHDFAEGARELPVDTLNALVAILFHGHAVLIDDRLVPALRAPPQPLGVAPDRFVPPPDAPVYGPTPNPPPLWAKPEGEVVPQRRSWFGWGSG
jgi:hypothetical protein